MLRHLSSCLHIYISESAIAEYCIQHKFHIYMMVLDDSQLFTVRNYIDFATNSIVLFFIFTSLYLLYDKNYGTFTLMINTLFLVDKISL